ncbi:TIGR01777 family oxidoreductase [Thiomicrospira microaerophila]|uniref:TIGR01777 family oxidoreductase n=1 Tax=Thiomicrospira microaerophila TaxID=406020 RepID=UPI0005C9921E|nr:TIGR01777 family oxidoreductase [Thiomicrospira microaerophila]
MNILLLGGTGFVGKHLANALRQDGHQVTQAGRRAFNSLDSLTKLLHNQQVVVQMSGANIGQRWNQAYKKQLYTSRIDTTALLAQALAQLDTPPQQVIAVSAIGIYPQTPCGEPVDESCTKIDPGFLGQLGQAWEQASQQLTPAPLILRFGVVLGKDGGALAKMLPAFKLGLGGPVASGEQCFSWVHIDDLIAVFKWALTHPETTGALNVSAPQPLKQKDFARVLAKTLHRPYGLPMPEFMLKLLFGEGAQVLTHSSCVLPKRLQDSGFVFQYPDAESALTHIFS